MKKQVIALKPGDVLVLAVGTRTVMKLQYLRDNVRVRIIFVNNTSIIKKQFDLVEVL